MKLTVTVNLDESLDAFPITAQVVLALAQVITKFPTISYAYDGGVIRNREHEKVGEWLLKPGEGE